MSNKDEILDGNEPVILDDKSKFEVENKIKILLNDYELCNDRINSFQQRQDTILQISMAILGGAIAFTLLNKIPEELYIAVPLIPIILFVHIMYHYTRNIANQGYRDYLEDKLNIYLGEKAKIKYTSVVKEYLLDSNPMAKVNAVVFPSVMGLAILYSIFMSRCNMYVIVGNFILVILLAIIIMRFFSFSKNLNNDVKKYCEKI